MKKFIEDCVDVLIPISLILIAIVNIIRTNQIRDLKDRINLLETFIFVERIPELHQQCKLESGN